MTAAIPVQVPAGEAAGEIKVRGSRFLAFASPVRSIEEALLARERARARHHDATHHVFAVRLEDGGSRMDDDGEPAGTGGRPVLAAIDGVSVVDVAVVVTRYFGGTKLGTGGLARAYGEAAGRALAGLEVRTMLPGRKATLSFGFRDIGAVSHLLGLVRALRLEERYGEGVQLDVALPASEWQEILRRLRDATAGRVSVLDTGERVLIPVDP